MAFALKLFFSLFVCAFSDLKCLPKGSCSKCEWPGWYESLRMLLALLKQRELYIPMERFPVHHWVAGEPHSQDALYGATIRHQQLLSEAVIPEYSQECALLMPVVVVMLQVKSSFMRTPRNWKSVTLSTCSPTWWTRLLSEHHTDSCSTSSRWADSSPPEMSPTIVVSSAILMMALPKSRGNYWNYNYS